MTETDTGKPAQRDASRSPANRERRTGSGDGAGEIGGPKGPEPTRYGDWERNGRCTDF